MKNQLRMIPVHPALWKLHGERAYPTDLFLTYTASLLVTGFNLFFIDSGPAWKTVVIVLLSLDIGGGVVSNFSRGTIDYYRGSGQSPLAFIWLHLFQSLALMIVYPELYPRILLVVMATLAFASFVVIRRPGHSRQPVGTFLLVVVLLLTLGTVATGPLPLLILLVLLPFKLVAGFAANHSRAD